MRKKTSGWAIFGAAATGAYVVWQQHKQNKRIAELKSQMAQEKLKQHNQQQYKTDSRENSFNSNPIKEKEQIPTQEELKKLYHSVVSKYHPDFAQSETDKVFRTELTKKINKAYQDGDYRTLLQFKL